MTASTGGLFSRPQSWHGEDQSTEDSEEEECRVCRGPAEEGRQLVAPCKCSGSIGLTHQDCLTSWLAVTRGDGRCELCKTKFQFAPKYAENAPERLPLHEVLIGLASRLCAKWLPLAFRIVTAVTLWLIIAPLVTAYAYHGWLHRPSSIPTRWKLVLLPGDIVSGAVIGGVIVISFLSLMSFADFLRLHWQQRGGRRRNLENRFAAMNDVINDTLIGEEVDYTVLNRIAQGDGPREVHDADELDTRVRRVRWRDLQRDERISNEGRQVANDPPNEHVGRRLDRGINAAEALQHRLDGEGADGGNDDDENDEDDRLVWIDRVVNRVPALPDDPVPAENDIERQLHDQARPPNDGARVRHPEPILQDFDRFEPQFEPLDPAIQDDQADVEINVALDELLGLRGPLAALVRNLLWLLTFNSVYLGIFVFVPRSVGSAVYSMALNTTTVNNFVKSLPYVSSRNSTDLSLTELLQSLNDESAKFNTTFLFSDLATVMLGYISCALTFVLVRYLWLISHKFTRQGGGESWQNNNVVGEDANGHGEDMAAAFGQAFTATFEAAAAVVKVGVLLFLKMFMLPLLLGIWLDTSTLALCGSSPVERVRYAGRDLFASILLHWVAGITFMLLVTVSVLQLREVVHPELLSHVIRPQEPQPDLLGNLLQESVATHSKRMFLSLAIYAALLTVHVSIPSYLLRVTNIGKFLPFFKVRLWHIILPQLQVPLELLMFHLSVLALLEKYKNHIGELQHRWLALMCRKLSISDQMLPMNVDKFVLVGTRPVFRKHSRSLTDESPPLANDTESVLQVDWFWYDLIIQRNDIDAFIASNIIPIPLHQPSIFDFGRIIRNGRKDLSDVQGQIRLPFPGSDWLEKTKYPPPEQPNELPHLLPSSIGSYRLKLHETESRQLFIQFWKEVPGELIPRPPEGWDDLGVGGAIVQGRWAWGKERKSTIEEGVAHREVFFTNLGGRGARLVPIIKISVLLFCSWMAVFLVSCTLLSLPLIAGRQLYRLLRIPDRFVHDPLAFVVGCCFLFGIFNVLRSLNRHPGDFNCWCRFKRWISTFTIPPIRKSLYLFGAGMMWFVVSPCLLGLLYELALVKSGEWFLTDLSIFDLSTFFLAWLLGFVILNSWAYLCCIQAFTMEFWINFGMDENQARENNRGANRPDGNNNINHNGQDHVVENNNFGPRSDRHMNWQGSSGRIARFMDIWRSTVVHWEWDKVDSVVLIHDCAQPVITQLATALMCPTFLCIFLHQCCETLLVKESHLIEFAMPLVGHIGEGFLRQTIFRLFVLKTIVVQLCFAFREPIKLWFRAAHQAARDSRYLIGEVLLDYVSESSP